jgi:hypothetical protein
MIYSCLRRVAASGTPQGNVAVVLRQVCSNALILVLFGANLEV